MVSERGEPLFLQAKEKVNGFQDPWQEIYINLILACLSQGFLSHTSAHMSKNWIRTNITVNPPFFMK